MFVRCGSWISISELYRASVDYSVQIAPKSDSETLKILRACFNILSLWSVNEQLEIV